MILTNIHSVLFTYHTMRSFKVVFFTKSARNNLRSSLFLNLAYHFFGVYRFIDDPFLKNLCFALIFTLNCSYIWLTCLRSTLLNVWWNDKWRSFRYDQWFSFTKLFTGTKVGSSSLMFNSDVIPWTKGANILADHLTVRITIVIIILLNN